MTFAREIYNNFCCKPDFKAFVFFLLALALVLPFQGSRPFVGRDEHRYPVVALEMLKSGDFLVPRFKGHIHLTKPPLTYWAIALGYKVLGKNPWGARLPNAVAFAVTVSLVFLLGKELWGPEEGKRAALFYLAMLVPFAAANVVTTDTILVLWETAALWAFVKGIREKRKGWFILMWSFWALAFLTKGMAMVPVATGAFLFWWFKRAEMPCPFHPLGLLIFFLLALPWYLYVWITIPGALETFWVEQIYGRLFSDTFHRNSKWYAPFYLYLPLLTLGALPASVVWVRSFFRSSWGAFKKALGEEWQALFLATLFGVPLIVFWIAKSRLPLYILPLFIPLALFTARLLPSSSRYLRFLVPWYFFLEVLKGVCARLIH